MRPTSQAARPHVNRILDAQLQTLGLRGMGRALEHQDRNPEVEALPFEDRLILLLQHEVAARQSHRLAQRLRWARLPQTACRQDYSVRYFQVPRLTDELLRAGAPQKKSAFFK